MSEPVKGRGMSGKDVITVGIFSAIYFVINFTFMLLGGLHPLLWILMPGFIALFTGIPYLMMCAKVQTHEVVQGLRCIDKISYLCGIILQSVPKTPAERQVIIDQQDLFPH